MKLPPLNALRSFEAAARLESFSQAANELHVTHTAISHQVKQLEDWLGRPLFRRVGRGVKLTPVGEELSAVASLSLSNLERAFTKQRLSKDSGILSVGCIASIASRWLIPALPEFSIQHPDITIQVLYARPEENLTTTNYDILITLGLDPSQDINSIKLFSRINKPVANPVFLSSFGPLDTPEKIAQAPLLHDEAREAWGEWFNKAGVSDVDLNKGSVFQDFNLLATAVIAGQGIALCPVDVFRQEIARSELVVLSGIATKENEGYYLNMPNDIGPAAGVFARWFAAYMDSQMKGGE